MDYDFKKEEKPDGFTILEAVWIGGKHIFLAEKTDAEMPYLTAERNANPFKISYDNGFVFDNFLDAYVDFADRIKKEIEIVRLIRKENRIEDWGLGKEVCIPDSTKMDFKNQYILVKAEHLSPEYRASQHQIFKAENGFGCSPDARGNAVFGKTLFDNSEVRYERYDIAGIIDPEKMPAWAQKKLCAPEVKKNEQEMEV